MNATQQSIDGEALAAVIAEWLDPNEVPHPALIAEILALVRPVEGVTLTPEEKVVAAAALRWALLNPGEGEARSDWLPRFRALAARLEAAQ